MKVHLDLASAAVTLQILLSALPSPGRARILRRSCGDYANFTYVVPAQVLQGDKLATVVVSSEEECESACVDQLKCKSVNLESSGSARKCELNRKSAADASDGVSLTPKAGWMFMSTSYTEPLIGHLCQNLNPCEPEHLCMDVCYSPGYRCTHCKELPLALPCVRTITNIALGKATTQSSTINFHFIKHDSSKAIDGVRTGKWNPVYNLQNCMHTNNERDPWWSVNFAGSAVVYSVTIYSRTDNYFYRVSDLHVKLGDENKPNANEKIWTTPTYSISTTSHTAVMNPPKKGKYMFVESTRFDYLDLCEVEVMGYLE